MKIMKIIIIGGDGFVGWPLALRLSNKNYEILILDNLSRRKIDTELKSNSLIQIKDINTRLSTWKNISGNEILFENIDVSLEYEKLCKIIEEFKPDTIIHLGEQRSAPYSMKNSSTKRYTVNNNLNATHNILCAIVDVNKDIHLIHLGTMGVYGYGVVPDTIVPEGYIDVKIKNKYNKEIGVEILHPTYPGSIYHMTKSQDAIFFQFFCKNYKLKITDLHQGIIWGAYTKETIMHNDLSNRFDYDSDYGTVLNRFIIESANNIPLTIYGTGFQTRAFINIENSMDCIELAINNPPNKGDKVKIFNQITETHKLIDLANLIKKIVPSSTIEFIENPRNELVENSLEVSNNNFLDLGLKPIYLNEENIIDIYNFISKNNNIIDNTKILPMSFW